MPTILITRCGKRLLTNEIWAFNLCRFSINTVGVEVFERLW
jgi:hypothetical protein